jgi:hypothetical protein
MAARTVTVINPAVLPSGTELFFGYSTNIHAVFNRPYLHQLLQLQQQPVSRAAPN